jgi:hypothetical protein
LDLVEIIEQKKKKNPFGNKKVDARSVTKLWMEHLQAKTWHHADLGDVIFSIIGTKKAN